MSDCMKTEIKKIILITLLLVLFLYLLQFDYTILGNIEKNGKNTYEVDTEYTTDVLKLDQVKLWVSYLEEEKYEEAFNMLSENCKKNDYDNNVTNFIEIVNKKYFDPKKEKKSLFYTKVTEEKNKTNIKTIFSVSIYIEEYMNVSQFLDSKDEYIQNHIIQVGVVETLPFQFKLEVSL